jgi:hypothetical protein
MHYIKDRILTHFRGCRRSNVAKDLLVNNYMPRRRDPLSQPFPWLESNRRPFIRVQGEELKFRLPTTTPPADHSSVILQDLETYEFQEKLPGEDGLAATMKSEGFW